MKRILSLVLISLILFVLPLCPPALAERADGPSFGDGIRANPGHSLTEFISWALTHVDPATIPDGASFPIPVSACGTQPWQYLYGTVRLRTDDAALRNFFYNHYGKQMSDWQYHDLTDSWDRNGYATDCQGLLDAWLTYEKNEPTDINVQMNYVNWCTEKGPIDEIERPYRIGEAVFVQAKSTGKMTHIGWICGFDAEGEPLTLDVRGIAYGCVVTRVKDRHWTHRGLMTAVFDYPSVPTPEPSGPILPVDEYLDNDEPTPRRAQEPGPLWFQGGTGTEEDPFRISAPEHLEYLAERVNSGFPFDGYYFRIMNDITLNGISDWTEWGREVSPENEWTPIGYWDAWNDHAAFGGVIDGGGHTIRGLYYFEDKVSFAGLFGYVSGGTLKNIRIDEACIHGLNNVGGIAGYIDGGARIENCSYRGYVDAELWTGGVVGFAESSGASQTVIGCASAANVSGFYSAGGVAGGATGGTRLLRSFSSGVTEGDDRVGGLVGDCRAAFIRDCYNSGRVSGTTDTGGLLGRAEGASAARCYTAGKLKIKRTGGPVAGLAVSGAAFENCFYHSEDGAHGGIGEPRTMEELQAAGSYTGFAFGSVWTIAPGSEHPFAQLAASPHIFAPEPFRGDADGDGIVTIADALLALRHAMGVIELDEDALELADLDRDWEVTAADALAILRIALLSGERPSFARTAQAAAVSGKSPQP